MAAVSAGVVSAACGGKENTVPPVTPAGSVSSTAVPATIAPAEPATRPAETTAPEPVAGPTATPAPPGPTSRPPTGAGSVSGAVFDLEGQPLPGVEVRTENGFAGTTDAQGLFEFTTSPSEKTVVALTLPGFIPQFRVISVAAGQTARLVAALKPEAPSVTLNADAGGTTNGGGVELAIPPSALVFEDSGEPVSGEVEISITAFSPGNDEAIDAFPGEFTGVTLSGNTEPIETFGFTFVNIEQDGRRVQLDESTTATVRIPVPDGFDLESTDLPSLWGFDEETGRWREARGVTIECEGGDCFFVGEVDHFPGGTPTRPTRHWSWRGKFSGPPCSRASCSWACP
jgi:hypothetical protein